MDKQEIIKNIAKRTNGDIYLGVVGAVRTGKSTFIKRMVETLIVPNIEDEYERKRALDEIPQSAAGKTIMTTEPKFVPNNAANIKIDDFTCNIRLIDCVGYMIDKAQGATDENIIQAIPNSKAWQWMTDNVPLFDCPQKQFEEMWYYRWWTLRKHIRLTPVGYAMTEFLVPRSYADQYNLIASGVGHHIMESRWLRQTDYLDQIMNTWYKGNNGEPMKKIANYSSWMPHALWQRYAVDGRKDWICNMLPSLEWEYNHWESTHTRKVKGQQLYWQADVQDAMEETISGGRRKKYLRPSINAYMFGNAQAIGNIAALSGDPAKAERYYAKADSLQEAAHTLLWNTDQQFFETHRVDSSACVREAIGFLPWYTHMAKDDNRYGVAWLQAADTKGFSAPYGLTTAVRPLLSVTVATTAIVPLPVSTLSPSGLEAFPPIVRDLALMVLP